MESRGSQPLRSTPPERPRPARRRTPAEPAFGSWSVEGQALNVTYDWSVLDEISAYAIDGFHKLSRGGLEVGGILYGAARGDNSIEIRAWQPIECEHARGPAFLLSKKDLAGIARQIEKASEDPTLDGFEPVGWFVSHTRTDLKLGTEDLEFFDEYFPEPWHVAMVLKPDAFKPTRAGFFFREADDTIRVASSYKEFTIDPTRPRPVTTPPADSIRKPAPEAPLPKKVEPVPVKSLPAPAPAEEPVTPSRFPGKRWLIVAAGVLILAAFALAAMHFLKTEERASFPMRLAESGGLLRIEWDRSAAILKTADRVTIEITDGGAKVERLLSKDELPAGSIVYQRQSGDVKVRVVVQRRDGPAVEEIARYIGPPVVKNSQ